jgi:TfoX/Sxy family transcriptional regulator of competence genes
VRKVLAGQRDVVAKSLMGGLCFTVKDGMCCSVSGKGGLLVRVAAEAYERILGEPHVQPMKMGQRAMTGFVRVAPEGYRTDAALKTWIGRGLDAVAALKAKPSRARPRRKAAKR